MNMNNSKNVLNEVLDIINSSTRQFPAHFTSNSDRPQTFCLSTDIDPNDEYEMASEAFRKATDPLTIKTGEDIMLAAYFAVKLGGEAHTSELQDIIFDHQSKHNSKLRYFKDYFTHCREFGQQLAAGSNY